MKKILTTITILAFGVFAHAQYFDMQRSLNINGESNPIRPEITNEFSHLGAAYTIGEKASNLTGDYGDYFVLKLAPSSSDEDADILFTMSVYNQFNELLETKLFAPQLGMRSTLGADTGFLMIFTADKLAFRAGNSAVEPLIMTSTLFDKLGGYVDYVAISGSGGQVIITNFQFGNGWIEDVGTYGLTNMATMRGYALDAGFEGNPSFSNGNFIFNNNNSVTFTSKAVAWNAETGIGISGSFSTGGFLGLQGWNHLTFTFGSFERVPAAPVPEPGTLLVLGLAAVGLPAVRRLRKG